MKHTNPATLIAAIPLFADLPQVELDHLAASLRPCEFAPGEILLGEGQADERVFILLAGEVEVIKALGTPDERLLAVQGGGSLFGEMGLFDLHSRHTASVRARSPAHALQMTRPNFDALLQRWPLIAYNMVRVMSRRLEDSENTTILDLRQKNAQLTRAYHDLQAAQEGLVLKEKLEKELAIAREIQESILPESLPTLQGFDFAAMSVPARAVGGDYYDFIPLEGQRVGVVVGDACDKGIPAALFINLANSLVHVEAPRNSSPEAALRLVNQHLASMNRSGMFVTLVYGILDVTGRFDYCRAGHPHPMVMSGVTLLQAPGGGTGMPLGILEEIQLDARSTIIPPGGLAVLYSDGLSEAEGPGGRLFGEEGLAQALPELSHLPAAEVCAGLWQRVQRFAGSQPQSDDFTVVVIKREG